MKNQDFQDYLYNLHADQYEGLDDEMPDDYENWISDSDPEDLISYANKFSKSQYWEGYKNGLTRCQEIIRKKIE